MQSHARGHLTTEEIESLTTGYKALLDETDVVSKDKYDLLITTEINNLNKIIDITNNLKNYDDNVGRNEIDEMGKVFYEMVGFDNPDGKDGLRQDLHDSLMQLPIKQSIIQSYFGRIIELLFEKMIKLDQEEREEQTPAGLLSNSMARGGILAKQASALEQIEESQPDIKLTQNKLSP